MFDCSLTMAQGVMMWKDGKSKQVFLTELDSITFFPSVEHEYVDLGLPSGTLWATMNIGATSPEDYGDYFAWGEVWGYNSAKRYFAWDSYKWCKGSNTSLTKYCLSSGYGDVDGKDMLDLEDDAANANWGEEWQIPSVEQMDELQDTCYTKWTWIKRDGINGYEIKSLKNEKIIFLPATGYYIYGKLTSAGDYGNYWLCTLNNNNQAQATCMAFYSNIMGKKESDRYIGRSVRAVRVKKANIHD